jgi:HEPN domain-containing protein
MANRARDWFDQAVRDLEHAEDSRRAGHHGWECFASHQAAEKAVKALHHHNSQEAWGHVVARLLQQLPSNVTPPQDLVEKGKFLDGFYVPPRYPNAHPEGAPFEHFGTIQSEDGIRYAREVIEFVRAKMA